MLVPPVDVLLAVVGQADEPPVAEHAPEDVVRLLLILHVHDARARDFGIEHIHVTRHPRISLDVEPQLHDAPAADAREQHRVLDQHRLELHRPLGALQVELDVLRAERGGRDVLAHRNLRAGGADDERVAGAHPAHLVDVADGDGQVQRVVGQNLAHRVRRVRAIVPGHRGVYVLPAAPPQPIAPESRLVRVGRTHARPPRAHPVVALGRGQELVRRHARADDIGAHLCRARHRRDLEHHIARMQELPQHPGVAVVVLPLLVDGTHRAGRRRVHGLVELAARLADVARRNRLGRLPLRRRDVHRLQAQQHPDRVVVEDGRRRGDRDVAARPGQGEVHPRIRLALERTVRRRIGRERPARVPRARQRARLVALAADVQHVTGLRDGHRRGVLGREQVFLGIRTRDGVHPRRITVAAVDTIRRRVDNAAIDVVELEGLRARVHVGDLHIPPVHLGHADDAIDIHPVAVRRVGADIGHHAWTGVGDARDVDGVFQHHTAIGVEPAVVVAELDDIRLVEGELEPLQPHPLVGVPRLQHILRPGTPLRRPLRGRDEPPHPVHGRTVLLEVGPAAHQRPDLAPVEVDDGWIDVRHQSLTDSQVVSAMDSGGFSMALARTASMRHIR